jgi:hypothetical protein
MELLLNLAWFAIAIAAFARFGVWAYGETDRSRIWAVALATVCVIALLFPIISITDDLEASDAVFEESVAVRRVVAPAALHVLPILAAALTLCLLAIALTLLGFVTSKAFALPSAPALLTLALRGPPLSGCC